jgi:hypothetical protein
MQARLLLFLSAIIFVLACLGILFIEGSVWVGEHMLPWLAPFSWAVLGANIIIGVPLALIPHTRATAATVFVIASWIYGVTLWFWALVLTYSIWGLIAVFIGLFLLGVGVVPVAMLATLFNGQLAVTAQLILLTLVTFGARTIGLRLALEAGRDRLNRRL